MAKITPKVVAGRVYVFMFLSQKLHQRLWLAGSTCSREDGRSGDHRHRRHDQSSTKSPQLNVVCFREKVSWWPLQLGSPTALVTKSSTGGSKLLREMSSGVLIGRG